MTVDDDETLGVIISPTAIAVQAGGSNSYTVVLGSLPSGDVTVTLAGHEGAVLSLAGIDNGNALTFTQDNWHAPQTVSVSADAEAQSSTITIGHSVASADDPDYAAAAAPDVAVSVLGAPDTIQIQVGVATSVQELEVPEGGSQHLLHGAEPPAQRGRDGNGQQPHRQLRGDGHSEEPDLHPRRTGTRRRRSRWRPCTTATPPTTPPRSPTGSPMAATTG